MIIILVVQIPNTQASSKLNTLQRKYESLPCITKTYKSNLAVAHHSNDYEPWTKKNCIVRTYLYFISFHFIYFIFHKNIKTYKHGIQIKDRLQEKYKGKEQTKFYGNVGLTKRAISLMNVNPFKSIHCIVEKRKKEKESRENLNTNTKEENKKRKKGRGGGIH